MSPRRVPGNVVWLDDVTSFRVLINASLMPDPEAVTTETEADAQPDKPTHPSSGESCFFFEISSSEISVHYVSRLFRF